MCQEHPRRFGLPNRDDVAEAAAATRTLVTSGAPVLMSGIIRLYRGQNDIAFPKWWKRALVVSAVLILISVASFFTRGLNLGIDFVGRDLVGGQGAQRVGQPCPLGAVEPR